MLIHYPKLCLCTFVGTASDGLDAIINSTASIFLSEADDCAIYLILQGRMYKKNRTEEVEVEVMRVPVTVPAGYLTGVRQRLHQIGTDIGTATGETIKLATDKAADDAALEARGAEKSVINIANSADEIIAEKPLLKAFTAAITAVTAVTKFKNSSKSPTTAVSRTEESGSILLVDVTINPLQRMESGQGGTDNIYGVADPYGPQHSKV